jgi:hypothetical protein
VFVNERRQLAQEIFFMQRLVVIRGRRAKEFNALFGQIEVRRPQREGFPLIAGLLETVQRRVPVWPSKGRLAEILDLPALKNDLGAVETA